jgi:serine/threonine-protein kinase
MSVEGEIHLPTGLPPVGTLVGGKYLLERYIAEGGMGVIAVGRHVELDEPVALKFLKPDIVSADRTGTVASRFVREARATIKIRSEHVPRIFDVTTLDAGVPFIVMEFLVGEDLDKRLERDGPLPIVFVVDLLLQALEALAAAHALGMVHRDLKPANLFVATRLDGTTCVKVLDFGIAKLVDRNGAGGDHGLTGTNTSMGSPRYMSPEQMRSARDVDARADIWAIGTTIYELLTGVAPFEGETLTQVCAAILQDEPESILRRRPDVPRELEAVVRRCLSKRPADRYGDVAEFAAALAPFGTAPSAGDTAWRVARVLGTKPAAQSSPSLSISRPSLEAPRPSDATVVGTSTISATSTSWGASGAATRADRRKILTIASMFAVLFVTGAVLGGVALFRARSPATGTLGGGGSNIPPSAPASGAPAAEVSGAVSAGEPPTIDAPARPPATGTPLDVGSTAKPRAKPSADPRPGSTGAAKTPTAPTSTTKATASPPAGGLWDDRK